MEETFDEYRNECRIIKAAKDALCDATNIEEHPAEWAVIDSTLFRMWQMGWLPGQEPTCKAIPTMDEMFIRMPAKCSECGSRMADHDRYCASCGARVVE